MLNAKAPVKVSVGSEIKSPKISTGIFQVVAPAVKVYGCVVCDVKSLPDVVEISVVVNVIMISSCDAISLVITKLAVCVASVSVIEKPAISNWSGSLSVIVPTPILSETETPNWLNKSPVINLTSKVSVGSAIPSSMIGISIVWTLLLEPPKCKVVRVTSE